MSPARTTHTGELSALPGPFRLPVARPSIASTIPKASSTGTSSTNDLGRQSGPTRYSRGTPTL